MLVELPEGAKEAHLDIRTGRICWSALIEGTRGGRTWHYLSSDYSGASAIGILSDLTEDQFAECVNVYEVSESINIPKMRFYQMLESEKVYMENPYGEDQRSYSELMDGVCRDKLAEDMRMWQEAQSRTIDPKRTVVLLRKETAE